MKSKFKILYLFLFISLCGPLCAHNNTTEKAVFVNEQDGYCCFRIPAIIRCPNGNLLAFAEGRKNSSNDFGEINIVMKRSSNNGKTWDKLQIVASNNNLQAGNPSPVVDFSDPRFPHGRIFLFYNTGNRPEPEIRKRIGYREVWYKTSTDNGKTWNDPVNITLQVHHPNVPQQKSQYTDKKDWRSYALAPGHAIQLTRKYKGRIVVPANHSEGEPTPSWSDYKSHLFYTDDHGKTFHLSESVPIESSNESTAVELQNGDLMENMRIQSGKIHYRGVAISKNGGQTWDTTYIDKNLPDPVCEGSILSIPYHHQQALLFSNPNSQINREKMTVRMSLDDGKTWPYSKIIFQGNAQYSDLVIQADHQIGILYEKGTQGIYYTSFSVSSINNH